MKLQLVRDAAGGVLGTVAEAAPDEVPVEAELTDGLTVEEEDIDRRDLFDIDQLHRRFTKAARK